RLIGSPKIWDRGAALTSTSTSTLHWFETELLTREENLVGLMAVNRDVIGQVETANRSDRVVLDMDSSESPVHGEQKAALTTGTSSRFAIIRCFSSTVRAIVWRRNFAQGTFTAPTTGTSCSCR